MPPVLQNVSERVEVSPARKVWKVTYEGGRAVGCWVRAGDLRDARSRTVDAARPQRDRDDPARYETRARTVVTQPARTV